MLGLSNEGFGLFAGTAINDTSSVTAAATAWDGIHGSNTLESAAIVKMTRTLAIIPITLVLCHLAWKKREEVRRLNFQPEKILPFFVLFFVLASVVTTVFQLPAAVTDPLKELSKFLIVMAMAAIGLNTNIVKLVKTGGKTDLHRILLLAGDLTCKFRDAARARHMVDLSKNGNGDVVKFDFTTSPFPFFIH